MSSTTTSLLLGALLVAGCAWMRPVPPRSAVLDVEGRPGWQDALVRNARALDCVVDVVDATRVVLRPCRVLRAGVPASAALSAQPFREPAARHGLQNIDLEVVARSEVPGIVTVDVVTCAVVDPVYDRRCPGSIGMKRLQDEALDALTAGFVRYGPAF